MLRQEEVIALNGVDKDTILSICYSSFKKLGWDVLSAGENILLGYTAKSWKGKSQQIIVSASDNVLNITSETIHGESLDIAGKNKKNITAFTEAFNTVKSNISDDEAVQNKAAIDELKIITQQNVKQEVEDVPEVDAAMNLSNGNIYFTYIIMGINTLLFILMAINGAGLLEPNGLVHLQWGSNFAPLTLSGDWWRLFTSTFLHFGIIHLAMNMYCLYTVSVYLEPMLGKKKFIAAYLCTGILSSLTSLWWHTTPVNSAGASGSVFGMYGVFLALLTSNLIPKKLRQPLVQNIGIFIAYNLIYGIKGSVDNAAHVGGLLSGFAIGQIYIFTIKKEKRDLETKWAIPVIILASIALVFGYLSMHKSGLKQRNNILDEISAAGFKDNNKFDESFTTFLRFEEKAIAVKPSTDNNDEYKKGLQDISIPNWEGAAALAKRMQGYTVNVNRLKKASILYNYAILRQEEAKTIIEMLNTNSSVAELHLKEIAVRIDKVMEELQ